MVSLFHDRPDLFNRKTLDGKRPLDIAAEYGNLQIVQVLFQHPNWKQAADKGASVLVNAALSPSKDNVLLFLKNKNFLIGHHTALHLACRQLHGHNMISHLINPESIKYQDKQNGFSPLMVAVQHRQVQCMKELLDHESHTQEVFELRSPTSLRTVLHVCAEVNQDQITKVLFGYGHISDSLLKATDLMGNTALHVCAEVGNVCMIKRLLSPSTPVVPIPTTSPPRTMTNLDYSGKVPSKSSPTTTTALGQVLAKEYVSIMLTKKNKSKLTPLHVAIHFGKFEVIKEMLEISDASDIIKQSDNQRRTSLHMAAEKGERMACLL